MDNLDTERKKCGYCGEEIQAFSRRCPFCGSIQEKPDASKNAVLSGSAAEAPYVESGIDTPDPDTQSAIKLPSYEGNEQICEEKRNSGIPEKGFSTEMRPEHSREGFNSTAYGAVRPLSNRFKVSLTVIASIIPGIGQLVGIIAAIAFINEADDPDRYSFGRSLLTASIIVFVLSCIFYGMLLVTILAARGY